MKQEVTVVRRLKALAIDPADRAEAELLADELGRAAAFGGLERIRDFLRHAHLVAERDGNRSADADHVRGMLDALQRLCGAYADRILDMTCPRCDGISRLHHAVTRPLLPTETRACGNCMPALVERGMVIVKTDQIDLRCHRCHQNGKPSHILGKEASITEMRVCDRCAGELRAQGWCKAVTISYL